MILTKDELQRLGGIFPTKKVESAELGGEFYVRVPTTKQFDELQELALLASQGALNGRPFRSKAVAYFLCDENGNRLYADNEISRIDALNGKIVDIVFTAGWRFSKLGDDEAGDAIEQLEKNSEETH